VTFPGLDHSCSEERYAIIGLTSASRIPAVYRTDRVRIISTQEETRNERRFYEDGEQPRTRRRITHWHDSSKIKYSVRAKHVKYYRAGINIE
jgi:hypothetical protein